MHCFYKAYFISNINALLLYSTFHTLSYNALFLYSAFHALLFISRIS